MIGARGCRAVPAFNDRQSPPAYRHTEGTAHHSVTGMTRRRLYRMGIVATLLSNPVQQARARDALRQRYSLVACADWSDVLRTCTREPVALVVLELHAPGDEGFRRIRQFRRIHPSITLVLYLAVPPAHLRDLFEAGRFGVDGLLVADHDDAPQTILSVVEQAEARGLTQAVRASLGSVRPTARDAMLLAVTRAHQRLTPQQLAATMGIRRRALAARLETAGFPPPQRLITWGRLIVAGQLLADEERSADSVSVALDFPSGSAFRNTCQRYVQRTPLEIRSGGGARVVLRALAAELAAGRAAQHADEHADELTTAPRFIATAPASAA